MKSLDHAMVMNNIQAADVTRRALPGTGMAEERLPFTVKVVRGEDALRKAVSIRQAAYARHMPELAEKLRAPESLDHGEGSVVLLAESKLDGSPLGTMRIQSNHFNPLSIEQGVELPAWIRNEALAEATRLGIDLGRTGRLVKTVLFKALYLYCVEVGINWMVIGARSPLDRMYDALLFQDLFPGQYIPMRHFNDIPHRVLALDIPGARARWEEAQHPLLNFMCHTHHPDIDLGEPHLTMAVTPVKAANSPAQVAISA